MSNNTTTNTKQSNTFINMIAYYALILVIVGTLCNLLTFIVLSRLKFRSTKERPILHYMRAVAVFDILMLYGWNLDHYLLPIHGFELNTYTIVSCKFFTFLNYFASQTSAWLRVLICLDRYVSLSRLHRTWFSQSKHAFILIASAISFFVLLNIHLAIFSGSYTPDGRVTPNTDSYRIHPTWDFVQLVVYNCFPFFLMITFNTGVIYHLIRVRSTTTLRNSRIHHRTASITSLVTTFLFVIMTIPASVAYGFFTATTQYIVLIALDSMLYTYHTLSFPLFMITFDAFRQEFRRIVTYHYNRRRVTSQTILSTVPLRHK